MTIACLGVAPPLPAQVVPAARVDLGARDIDVLRDVIAQAWVAYKGPDGLYCLDPTVALYRGNASRPRERWSADVLSKITGATPIPLDTLTAALPREMRGCTRSQTTWRVAYGRPRVSGDSGAIVVIGTRLDARGGVDSQKVDARLTRRSGTWTVDGLLEDSATVHRYVKGEGCYRLWYAPLPVEGQSAPAATQTRIDTTEVRAESIFVGKSWRTFPAYRLSRGPRSLGVAAQRWSRSIWYVTHDSVNFEWSRYNEDVVAVLLVVGDSIRGTMHSETDAIVPNPPTTSVTGRRIPCK